jgi:monovalent cation:proton antiporter-2 (CPA2) family protein
MHDTQFFLTALIYLATAVVLVPVAQRLGLGSVLGYLIGGTLIGPHILAWVGGAEGKDTLQFAEFGVVIMLFMIGLELEPSRLWRLRGPIFGLGGLQVLLTMLVTAAVALVVGCSWKASLAIGMILSLSSTAIVLQTLQEKALSKTLGGEASFAVLLFQDISVIPMLAIFPLLAMGGAVEDSHDWLHTLPGWAQPIATLAAVLFIVLAGRFLVPRGFNILAKTGLRELLTAAALLLIIGVAILMTEVGLSPALGAFVAGVVLASSQYRHELESNLEPFKGLLLGLFFLAIGSSLDFTIVSAQPGTIALLVLALILVKTVVMYIITCLWRLPGEHGWLLALALAQGGEFAFALLSMAAEQKILPESVTKLLLAVVALSMAVTPLLFMLYERVIAPRFTKAAENQRQPDTIDEHAPVIIAGYGRFGNFVGRVLNSQGVKVTVLESDPDHVDMLRSFGFKVFYGDATRIDLLQSAGLEHAKLLIICIIDRAQVAQLIRTTRERFPHVRILARAFDYDHRFELERLGLTRHDVIHEQMGSATELATRAIRALGKPALAAERARQHFLRYDEETRVLLEPFTEDFNQYASIISERRIKLAQLFEADLSALNDTQDKGWET